MILQFNKIALIVCDVHAVSMSKCSYTYNDETHTIEQGSFLEFEDTAKVDDAAITDTEEVLKKYDITTCRIVTCPDGINPVPITRECKGKLTLPIFILTSIACISNRR